MTQRRFGWRITAITLAMVLAVATLTAQKTDTAAMAMRAAMDTELVKGDPEAAIKAYQAIVEAYGKADRAAAAEALLRMAECYRKLGDVQARRVYERVVSQFGDQREPAATARARIAADTSELRNRLVWSVPDAPHFWGNVSPDGRLLAYGHGLRGDLYVRDLALGTDRRLTNSARPGTPPARADQEGYGDDVSAFSGDGRYLAHAWSIGSREELRLVDLETPGMPTARVLLGTPDIRWVQPFTWSPDRKSIAVGIWRFKATDTELGVLSVDTGAFRLVKRLPDASSEAIGGVTFSPNGQYLSMNSRREAGGSAREIVIINLATGAESRPPLSPGDDKFIGWSPDGGIVFTSDRTGALALWHAPFANGAVEAPRPLDAAPFGFNPSTWWDMGLTQTGALYYRVFPQSLTDVRVAAVNFDTGRLASMPVNAADEFVGASSQPALSLDGTQLAFLSRRSVRELVLVIRSLETGATRDLRPGLTNMSRMLWAPDGSALYCTSRSTDRSRVFRIDARTGQATPLVERGVLRQVAADGRRIFYQDTAPDADGLVIFELDVSSSRSREVHRGPTGGALRLAISSDGRRLYYRNPVLQSDGPHDLVAKDLGTGQESVLVAKRRLGALYLSPDGRFVATDSVDAANRPTLLVVPTDGSGAKDFDAGWTFQEWAPDGRSIIATKSPSPGQPGRHWLVPVDGRPPVPLAMPDSGRNLRSFSAQGRWLAFQEADATPAPWAAGASQIWVLENFLPKPQGGRGAGGRR